MALIEAVDNKAVITLDLIVITLDQRFPTTDGVTCTRGGYICLPEWVHLRLAIEGKNMFMYYLFPDVYTYIS